MSWNSYVDVLISASLCNKDRSSYIKRGCLIGLDGVIWTDNNYPNTLKPSFEECQAIAKCFRTSEFTTMKEGVKIDSHSYYLVENELVDSKAVYCKDRFGYGIIMQASQTGIVVGTCLESDRFDAVYAISYITDYLKKIGY